MNRGIHGRRDMRFLFQLPKTVGGTLGVGIRNNPGIQWPMDPYYPRPGTLPAPSSDQIWLGGHASFGLHLLYDAAPIYITVMREPVERLISEFFYHHQHNIPGIFIPDDELIPAFVRLVESAAHLNAYSYMFSDYCFAKESIEAGTGAWDGSVESASDMLRRRNTRLGFLAENIPFHSVDTDDAFRKASRNIHMMNFIGFFDRIETTTAYLKDAFGLTVDLKSVRMHKTRWMPTLEDLPAPVQSMLVRKTDADREFLHYARRQAG